MNAEIYPHFWYFFSNFCKLLFHCKRSWQYFLLKQQTRAFFYGNSTAQFLKFASGNTTVNAGEKDVAEWINTWVMPLGQVESSKSQSSVVVAKLCSKRSLFRTIECMINAKITSLDIRSTLSWLVRQGVFHLRAGRLNLKLKGNKMKTVLRKGCLRKKLVNRFICAENA